MRDNNPNNKKMKNLNNKEMKNLNNKEMKNPHTTYDVKSFNLMKNRLDKQFANNEIDLELYNFSIKQYKRTFLTK
jgi:hypothetical protein